LCYHYCEVSVLLQVETPTHNYTCYCEKSVGWQQNVVLFRPTPQLFLFVNRLGHDGNRPEILKYSVSVPNMPGSNYRDSFTVPDFSTPTLHTECLGSQSLWKMKIVLGEHIRLTAFLRRQIREIA
jgi:hypothetical protein